MEKRSYKEIRLLEHNPRYTRSIDIDLLNINYGEKYDIYKIIEKLLQYEAEWDDLLDLLEQLILGYNPAMDQIFILEGKDKYFYSIEGNRRIMCMYLLSDFDKFKDLLKNFSSVKNYKKVIDILQFGEKPSFENLNVTEISLKEVKDEDEIWKIIYARHAGENKGKRSWPRLKYFYDLKDMFIKYKGSKLELKEIKKKLSYRFNKSLKSLDTDLNNGLWVIDVVDTYNNNNNDKIKINENNENISSLELARSAIKVEYADEQKTLTKLFEISVSVEKWEVTIKLVSKIELYNFLIKNLKKENYTTRGWKEEEIYILYEFVIKYLEPDALNSSTLRQEIELAIHTPFSKRTTIQKELLRYSKNIDILKNTHKQLLENKKEFENIKWGLFQIWKNNTKPLLDTLRVKSKNYPFLISSVIIRSSLELFSVFAVLKSSTLRQKLINIWETLTDEEKDSWNKPIFFGEEKYDFIKKDPNKLEKKILKDFRGDNIFEIIKKSISKNKINCEEILDMLYEDMQINNSLQKYKVLKTQIGYLNNFIKGNNNIIPNIIIHSYYYLEDEKNFTLAWEALNIQFEILINIIRIWLLDDLTIKESKIREADYEDRKKYNSSPELS